MPLKSVIKKVVSVLFLLLLPLFSLSQKSEKSVTDLLSDLLVKEINRFRLSKGLDTLQITQVLSEASSAGAIEMAAKENERLDEKNMIKRLKKAKATKQAEELTARVTIPKGKEDDKTSQIAKYIYSKWESSSKSLSTILNPKYTLTGISCKADKQYGKIYVSALFAGFDINNEGLPHKKELAAPFNSKSKKLQHAETRICKPCLKWKNYDLLQKGLYVSGNKIFLKYAKAAELHRILKNVKDGFAVDVVQKEQYTHPGYNIVNNNLYNKGVMSKVLYRDKFFEKNLLLGKDPKENKKIKAIEVEIGKFNNKINGPYELNLLVIQDGHVCKTVTRGFTEQHLTDNSIPIGLLPFKNSTGLKPVYESQTETSVINFVIPFEKNKSEFKESDIKPIITSLDEPNFTIDGAYIYAFSSIEGDSAANAQLQNKRANSVLKALQGMQKNQIKPFIIHKDSWALFAIENQEGKYSELVKMGKAKAVAKINSDKKLLKEMEPVFEKERFAEIVLDVTYNVVPGKDHQFSIINFNKAIKNNNLKQSYKILEFIHRKVDEGKYEIAVYDSLKIEENENNLGLINNKIYYKYLLSNTVENEDAETFDRLLKSDSKNPILLYNKIFCQLKLDSNAGNVARQSQVQKTINELYGKIDSNYVNGLNIQWQFKILETLDTLANADALIAACIGRIKTFYRIKENDKESALKLAHVFNRIKDYSTACALLEPFIHLPEADENLIFNYIYSASRVKEKYYSRKFALAMEQAKNKNPERFCKLFGEPFLTFQVLENPEVKKIFQGNCR